MTVGPVWGITACVSDLPLPRHHGARPIDDTVTSFGLWAPAAEEVVLVVAGEERPMADAGDGWWHTSAVANHGTRYAYRLDGDDPLPDPAARWLPDGVHGPSAVVDPRTWAFEADRFRATPVTGGVIYELHIGTFTTEGTFAAATEHLEALVDLGVTHVEVMPVNGFDGAHNWGYDGVAWWAVHQAYGGPDGLAAFVDACHRVGLAVILDVVHNHLGPSGNYLPRFGPYLQSDAESTWGRVINLDGPQSGPVRDFVIGSALAFLRDHRVDGLRLDAVHALDDRGSATHVLAELADAVTDLSERTGRPLDLIAETDRNDPSWIRPRSVGGMGLDAQWADDVHHTIHVAVTGETDGYYVDYVDPLAKLVRAWTNGLVHDGVHSTFRDRIVGARVPDDVSSRRLVACIQNHDQVGNRAAGDRLTTLVDADMVRVAAALLCVSPHTPMLFQGEEYGETKPFAFFSDMPGEELRQAIRDGRRREFEYFSSWQGEVPDPLAMETFLGSTLDRSAATTVDGRQRRTLWQDLLALRRTEPALSTGRRDLLDAEVVADGVVRMRRRPPGHEMPAWDVEVWGNLTDSPIDMPSAGRVLLSTADVRYGGPGQPDDHVVPPRSVVVLAVPTTAPSILPTPASTHSSPTGAP